MDGPYSIDILHALLDLLADYDIGVTSLRFLYHSVHWTIMDEFGPITLRKVFTSLPKLEALCLDHENTSHSSYLPHATPWPASSTWVGKRI